MKTIKILNSDLTIPIGKIVCVGRNYVEHIQELGNEIPEKPVVFLKPESAVIFSGDQIIYPDYSKDMHHEVELLLLIGKKIKNVSLEEAEDSIIAYGVGLDMTLRDVQDQLKKKGHPWTISKCFDTSAVLSEFIPKENHQLTLEEELLLTVNDEIKQKEKLNKMIFKPAELVQYLSSLMTLDYGDIIFTGTPKGVSKVNKGDKISASLDGLVSLSCSIKL
jgi:5-carboxymethyl-2-hydroxymuconate isomerase